MYAPRYESDVVSGALAAAEQRLIEAKNKLRAAKGLPPIGMAPSPPPVEIKAEDIVLPQGKIPAKPPERWGLSPTAARVYTTVLALAPISLDQLGRHIYGAAWADHRISVLKAHLSKARMAALRAGIVIPGQNRATGMIHRIHLRGVTA